MKGLNNIAFIQLSLTKIYYASHTLLRNHESAEKKMMRKSEAKIVSTITN